VLAEQSEPFTVMGSTLLAGAILPPVTVRTADPDAFPDLAIIIVVAVVAVEIAVAVLLLKIATVVSDEAQLTSDVMSLAELSE
jgi:hypothetical protein